MIDLERTFRLQITEDNSDWGAYVASTATTQIAVHENMLRAKGLEFLAEKLCEMACELRSKQLNA